MTTIAVFLSYGADTARSRWQELNSPTPIQNKFLPAPVNDAISCLKKSGVKNYRLVGDLKRNDLFYQRIAEGAWPIEMHESSAVVIAAKSQDPGCPLQSSVCAEGDIIVGICRL